MHFPSKPYRTSISNTQRGATRRLHITNTLRPLHTRYPRPGCLNIIYADDITQIVIQPVRSRRMLAIKVEREITKINYFEKKWKIKTNTNKFTVIPLAIKKTHSITINGANIPYSKEGKILGMNINTQGIQPHIKHTKRSASTALTTIKRFYKLSTKIKTHLVKACVLPIITYPTYPPVCYVNNNSIIPTKNSK